MTLRVKTSVRIAVVIVWALAAMRALPWVVTDVWVSAASPFVAVCSAIALRTVTSLTLAAAPLLLLGIFKGRWFCYHLCPVNFLLDCAGKLNPRHKSLFVRIPPVGSWILALTLGSAVAGVPLFLWLDPLALFNGFCSIFGTKLMIWKDLVPASGLCLIIILNACVPHIWCRRLCPLGTALGMLGRLPELLRGRAKTDKRESRTLTPSRAPLSWAGPGPPPAICARLHRWTKSCGQAAFRAGLRRRAFLSLLGGAGAGAAFRFLRVLPSSAPIRPPGAVTESQFAQLCARCGNCFQACPEDIVVPDLGQTGLTGILTPVLDIRHGYCNEWCHECTKVCPTGAIRRLTLDEKRALSIGTAHIDMSSCLAWADGKYCMVCQEYCPYQAIRCAEHGGVNCPVVEEDVCRGCGSCQNQCPASPIKAIVVRGISQRIAQFSARLTRFDPCDSKRAII